VEVDHEEEPSVLLKTPPMKRLPMVFAAGVCMWTPSESEADLSIRSRP